MSFAFFIPPLVLLPLLALSYASRALLSRIDSVCSRDKTASFLRYSCSINWKPARRYDVRLARELLRMRTMSSSVVVKGKVELSSGAPAMQFVLRTGSTV
jgi:hypothetical protein